MSNFITITKNNQVIWDDIKLEIRNYLKKYLEEGKIILEPKKLKVTGFPKLIKGMSFISCIFFFDKGANKKTL